MDSHYDLVMQRRAELERQGAPPLRGRADRLPDSPFQFEEVCGENRVSSECWRGRSTATDAKSV